MVNTISYNELKQRYTNNKEAKELAKEIFGDRQPSTHQIGFYSSPSWNWSYIIGICGVTTSEGTQWYEVVTQFGAVVAARIIHLPTIKEKI